MNSILQIISTFMFENIFLAIPVAFVAGIISAFSPCVLTTLPLIVGYISNSEIKDKKNGLLHSLVFTLGLSITFILIGFITAYIGLIFSSYGKIIYIILSIIMIISSLNIIGVFKLRKQSNQCSINDKPIKKGLIGVFSLGLFGGFVASPCATPVLAAILSFVASRGNPVLGVFMLLSYSIGNSILVIIAGFSITRLNKILIDPRNIKYANVIKNILAILILISGLYLFYLAI